MGLLSRFFRKVRSVEPRNPARFYRPCSGWGNAINVRFGEAPEGTMPTTARVSGHQPRKPSDGDIYLMAMQSGKTTVWVFHDVTYPGDPRDMFFGNLTFMGYEDETTLPDEIDDGGAMFL